MSQADDTPLQDRPDVFDLDAEIVETVQAVEEADLLVVNEDERTWHVTDVVDREISEEADEREAKRAVRLENGGPSLSNRSVFALLLETYPTHHTCELRVMRTPHWYEESHRYDVESVEILETDAEWVVVQSHGKAHHFPDPRAAARGEAKPACRDGFLDEADDYRFARLNTVRPSYRPCKNCARRQQPVDVPKLTCPNCGRGIASGVLHGVNVEAVSGIEFACPKRHCGFEGVVSLNSLEEE